MSIALKGEYFHTFYRFLSSNTHVRWLKIENSKKSSNLKKLLKSNLVSTMTGPSNPEVASAINKRSLRRLTRAITLSQGQFSVILVCCNDMCLQENLVEHLQAQSSVDIQTIFLSPSVNTLFTTIKTILGDERPQALMVLGLETVVAIEQVLVSTNLMRDEFRKQFPFPLVLCVNEEILQKMIRLAPDFKSWAANTILFEGDNTQLLGWEAIAG